MTLMNRLDYLTSIPDDYRRADPPAPPSVKIELTSRCNYACSFCAKKSKLRPQGDMEFGEFKRLTAEIRQAGVDEIGLFYLGESFLVDWLEDAIAHCKAIGFPYVFLTTNGSLATAERLQDCMAAGLDSLKFSLNWADVEQFSEVTGCKGKLFEKATRNIRAARVVRDAGRYPCKLYGSYVAYDADQAARMTAYLDVVRPSLDHIYELPLYTQAAHIDREARPDWEFSVGNRGRADALREPLPCWAVFTEGHVTWDSKLAACCFDHDGRFEMGDLGRIPFLSAWRSDAFQTLRTAHLNGDVRGTPCGPCIHGE